MGEGEDEQSVGGGEGFGGEGFGGEGGVCYAYAYAYA